MLIYYVCFSVSNLNISVSLNWAFQDWLGLFLSLDHESLDVRNLRDFLMYSINSKPLLSPLCIANLSENIMVQFLHHICKRYMNSIHLFAMNISSTRHWGEDIIKNLHFKNVKIFKSNKNTFLKYLIKVLFSLFIFVSFCLSYFPCFSLSLCGDHVF